MTKKNKSTFSGIDLFLKETFGNRLNQTKLADIIGEQQGRYSSYLNDTQHLSASAIHKYLKKIYDLGVIEGRKQNAENFFKAIRSIHEYETDALIAEKLILGKNKNARSTSLSKYRNGITAISEKQNKNILGKHSSKIFHPLVEFLACSPYKDGTTWKLFKKDKDQEVNEDEEKIKDLLSNKKNAKVGVYAMYDSSGKILYFGKTNKGLYFEITQRLDAVVHRDVALVRDGKFVHLGNKTKGGIRVGEMTRYISAIEVLAPEAIENIEAFVLRLIPNDDVNYKVENYK